MAECRAIANVQQQEQRHHHPQLSPERYERELCQGASETSCHTLSSSGEPERTLLALLLPLPSGFFEMGEEMASQVEGLRNF